MNLFVDLARKAVETFVKTGKIIPLPDNLPSHAYQERRGVFVSLHTRDGSLRGCIGTFSPQQKNLGQEIINNALAAATQDPRFPPVTTAELDQLNFKVDVLSTPKSVEPDFPLNPKKYGLIVSADDGRRGLLLPDIEGVDTPQEQIKICQQKAGILPHEPVSFKIFTVNRHQ